MAIRDAHLPDNSVYLWKSAFPGTTHDYCWCKPSAETTQQVLRVHGAHCSYLTGVSLMGERLGCSDQECVHTILRLCFR